MATILKYTLPKVYAKTSYFFSFELRSNCHWSFLLSESNYKYFFNNLILNVLITPKSRSMKIKHDKNNQQFYFEENGNKGHLKYELKKSNVLEYHSTYIDEEIRGEGYGKAIVRFALDYAADNNYKVIPSCRMVSTFIKRNDEYKKLIAS